jgi:hypothetical protein
VPCVGQKPTRRHNVHDALGNVTFAWVRDKITDGVDFEPKVLVSAPPGDPEWRYLDITPSMEYDTSKRFNLTASSSSVTRSKPTISGSRSSPFAAA